MTTQIKTPAGWYPDPGDRHQYRYWSGTEWTPMVSDNAVTTTDPVQSPVQQVHQNLGTTRQQKAQQKLAKGQQQKAQQNLGKAQELLSGEQVRYLVRARTGVSPNLLFWLDWPIINILNLFLLPFSHYRVLAFTDTSIVVFKESSLSAGRPKKVLERVPRTALGSLEQGNKDWRRLQIGEERFWVPRGGIPIIERASSEIRPTA